MKPAVIGGIVAALAGVGVVFALYQDVPGSLDQVCDTDPLGQRVAIIEIHGLNQETKDPDGMSYASAEAHFKYLNDGWDACFPGRYGVTCSSRFKRYVFRYNCNDDVYENARRLARHIAADPQLSGKDVKIILLGHSMGGLVALDYRDYSRDSKYLGMITLGTPFLGSHLSDPTVVRQAFVDLYHAGPGNTLADKAMKGIDFFTAGQQWLKPNNPKMRPILQRVPLDSNCYLFAGKVPNPNLSPVDKLWYTGCLLEIMFGSKNPTQQVDMGYKLGAGLVHKISHEDNDGVVTVSQATAVGFNQNCHTVEVEGNHSQLAKGAQGDLAVVYLTGDALMAIYDSQVKPQVTPGSVNVGVPNPGLSDLHGFVTKVDLESAQLAWVNNGSLVVSTGRNDAGSRLPLPGSYEWPQWYRDGLVVTKRDQGTDIIWITKSGASLLTTDGVSSMATVDESGNVVYLSAGKLMIRTTLAQGAKVLVGDGSLVLDRPPIILGKEVFFAQKNGSAYELYSIPLASSTQTLGSLKVVKSDLVRAPFEVKGQMYVVQPIPEGLELAWIPTSSLQRQKVPADIVGILAGDLFGHLAQLVCTGSGDYYLVADQEVRWLDRSKLPSISQALSRMGEAWIQGEKWAKVRIKKEELAPFVASGIQLDAK